MTMSLSVDRPSVIDPGVISCEPVRVRRAWNILVAMFPCSGGFAPTGGIGGGGACRGGACGEFVAEGGGPLTGHPGGGQGGPPLPGCIGRPGGGPGGAPGCCRGGGGPDHCGWRTDVD